MHETCSRQTAQHEWSVGQKTNKFFSFTTVEMIISTLLQDKYDILTQLKDRWNVGKTMVTLTKKNNSTLNPSLSCINNKNINIYNFTLIRSFSFIGTSIIPLTGGLFPLENLTRVTRPGSIANSAYKGRLL